MTKQIWANLPVKNVEKTRVFFKALGFKLNKGFDNGEQLASFLFGENNFVVHFFPHKTFKTASDNGIANTKEVSEILFTLSAESMKEVDKWAAKVKAAGGKIYSEPNEIQEGMYGCGFVDLDGHRWNVLYREKQPKSSK
jgi:predicted lactoylglutathione lyase